MADETNLSSKLPVANRTREVWGRKRCWWCLSAGFLLRTFLVSFADSFCFVLTSIPSYEASPLCSILCILLPWLCWYVEVFRVSLHGFFWPPGKRFPTWIFFGIRSSGILVTQPVHLNCANFRRVPYVHSASLPFSGLLCLESCLATWSLEVF